MKYWPRVLALITLVLFGCGRSDEKLPVPTFQEKKDDSWRDVKTFSESVKKIFAFSSKGFNGLGLTFDFWNFDPSAKDEDGDPTLRFITIWVEDKGNGYFIVYNNFSVKFDAAFYCFDSKCAKAHVVLQKISGSMQGTAEFDLNPK